MYNDELEEQLVKVRQALTNAVAVEIQIKQKIQKNTESEQSWERRAAMARSSSHEDMALQAEERIKQCKQLANDLQIELLSHQDFIAGLKRDLSKLEARRFGSGNVGRDALAAADNSLSAMDRFENKVLEHQAMADLTNDDVARKFADDKANDDLEDELKALKARAKKE